METTTCCAAIRSTPTASSPPTVEYDIHAAAAPINSPRKCSDVANTTLTVEQKKAFRIIRGLRSDIHNRNPEMPLPSPWFLRQLVHRHFTQRVEGDWTRSIHHFLSHSLELAKTHLQHEKHSHIYSSHLPRDPMLNTPDAVLFFQESLSSYTKHLQ